MNTKELIKYIKNYLENDRTRSAIMLTGPWGCGKSYYIQNELLPALTDEEHNKCIVVSLYGIKSLEALSKSIYLEIRAKAFIKNSEGISAAKIIGKTVVKGVASFFGVDINDSEEDLNKLYQSIDLTGKLIVLEDLERSGLSILEVMGYVNNLVEQDGVKVLLVANENEIIKYDAHKETHNGGKEKEIKVPTKETKEYLRIKEKTVRDTIPFYANLNSSIENILRLFDSKYFNEAFKEKTDEDISVIVNEIIKVMVAVKCYNFRALLYACQKTMEMFTRATKNLDNDYFKFVLCANTAFALKLSKSSNLVWKDDEQSPAGLGTSLFPLPKFCYDFIKNQYFDEEKFYQGEKIYLERKNFEIKQNDLKQAYEVLRDFYINTEEDVFAAVKKINEYLKKDKDVIPYREYGSLANYFIVVRNLIPDEKIIDECKEQILNNLKNTKIDDGIIEFFPYISGFELWTQKQKDEYSSFVKQMTSAAKVKRFVELDQVSSVADIEKITETIRKNNDKYVAQHSFASKIDLNGILRILPNCSALQIWRFRIAFLSVYNSSNIAEFLSEDLPVLQDFLKGIQDIIADESIDDKIIKQQFRWFEKYLGEVISRLN